MENVRLGIIWGHVNWSRVRILSPRANSVLRRPRKGTGFQNKQRACGHLLSCLLLIPQHTVLRPWSLKLWWPKLRNFWTSEGTCWEKSYSHSSPLMPSPYFEIDTWIFKVKYYKSTALGWPKHHYIETLSNRRRQWHPTPVLLPGISHGWRSPIGCSPWGP